MHSDNSRFLEQIAKTKILGLQIDKYLNWKEHVEYITPKLASALYAIRSMSTYVCTGMLKLIYHAYFHSLMKYGIIFWGNSINSKHIFILQKKGIRIMARAGKRDSCRNLFKKFEILTLPCEYIFSLMMFYIKNQDKFSKNVQIYNINTRHKLDLRRPCASLTSFQKVMHYECVKLFNSLPIEIK